MMTTQPKQTANYYQGVPESAVLQFRDACEKLLYEPGSDRLRADAFGEFPANALSDHIRARIEHLVDEPVQTAPKARVLEMFCILACDDMKFFEEVQYRMTRRGMTVPFYDAFELAFEQRPAAKNTDPGLPPNGIALPVAPEAFDSLATLGPAVAQSAAAALADQAQPTTAAPATAEALPTAMERQWAAHGEQVLQRAGDPAFTHTAVAEILAGGANRFHRDMTPEAIREARAQQRGKGEDTGRC